MARQPKISQNGLLDFALSQTTNIKGSSDRLFTCLTGLTQKNTMLLMPEANSITTIITKE